MLETNEIWSPGSFTKNFSWGNSVDGLKRLHEMIQMGFDGKVENVERSVFRERVKSIKRPDYIALNFFLYNSIDNSTSFVIADELVFQAVTFPHDKAFDKLGLFAFLLSTVGRWKGAGKEQSRPAEWARHYIIDRVDNELGWQMDKITATDIETFVSTNPRYKAKTARKLSTNLNYLFNQGRLSDFSNSKIEKWWVDAVFLTLDRTLREKKIHGQDINENRLLEYLQATGFNQLTGKRSIAKDIAVSHLVRLYAACGSNTRFSDIAFKERAERVFPELNVYLSNDPLPIGAISRSNPQIQKTLPRICAQVAKEIANFEVMELDDLENLDMNAFIRRNTQIALQKLKDRGIKPTLTAEQLFKITREK